MYSCLIDLLDDDGQNMRRLLPLATIEVLVWLALILCIFITYKIDFEIDLGNTLTERIATQTVRVIIPAVTFCLWLVAWKKLTEWYFWRMIRRNKTT